MRMFDYISDLHIDFYFEPTKEYSDEVIKNQYDKIFGKNVYSDVLLVAGDIGHDNHQSVTVLEAIARIYGYKQIVIVLGNHDYYIDQKTQWYLSSFDRIDEMKELCDASNIVTLLDGDVIEIDGIKIGGGAGWYDGSFYFKNNSHLGSYGQSVVSFWKRTMNDAHWIKGVKDFYDLFADEIKKVKAVYADVDIVMTHICPLSERIAFQKEYQNEDTNAFYAFDGEQLLEKTRAKFWLFGHSHGEHEFEIHGVQYKMNALGYPGEKNNIVVQTIEVFNGR